MATKANKNRYRTIRSVIASASILSLLPLFSLMRGGAAGDVLATSATEETSVQDAALAVANTQQAAAATTTSTIALAGTAAATPVATAQSTASKATTTSTASSTKTQSTATY